MIEAYISIDDNNGDVRLIKIENGNDSCICNVKKFDKNLYIGSYYSDNVPGFIHGPKYVRWELTKNISSGSVIGIKELTKIRLGSGKVVITWRDLLDHVPHYMP